MIYLDDEEKEEVVEEATTEETSTEEAVEVEASTVESTDTETEGKSKMVAGLLQLFLGTFGVGRFYLGYTGIGIAQILVTWLTCGLGAIWPFIDAILILTGSVKEDANGNPLKD